MDKVIKQQILADTQIKKFSLYGFLKNLKFFEPYLLIFLLGHGISLLEIGLLIAIREIIINIFEVPSGIIADHFGRKKELCLCFIFYMISFVLFFLIDEIWVAFIAMVFFGLGDAFRSGTHKAMIYTYLEHKGWENHKTFVYGKTRSCSLIGSATSSFLGILILLFAPNMNYIFLASIIPYAIDFVLILSYPDFLDKEERKEHSTPLRMIVEIKNSLFENASLRRVLFAQGIFDGTVSSMKDFIQPIIQASMTGVLLFKGLSSEDNLYIVLGVIYASINLLGSVASRKTYILKKYKSSAYCLNALYMALCASLLLLGFFISNPFIGFLLFLVVNMSFDMRKPIFVDELDTHMEKTQRASMLSISTQLKSLCVVILAPVAGAIADNFGIDAVMFSLAILLAVCGPITMLTSLSERKKG